MKVTATEGKRQELEYPKLMISTVSGDIVLFTEEGIGTVVKEEANSIGDYFRTWTADNFEDYTGKITLENS
tara:strand:+ start:384 stop:596 length:213 start_codon:yes stop_codon:yes gene_type:complete